MDAVRRTVFRPGASKEVELRMRIEFEQETDGRWIAEVVSLPGVMVYGATREEAGRKVTALALRVLADRVEQEQGQVDMERVEIAYA